MSNEIAIINKEVSHDKGIKAMNRPSAYEEINLVRLQKEMFLLSRSATGQRQKAGSTSHYESLQLKSLKSTDNTEI